MLLEAAQKLWPWPGLRRGQGAASPHVFTFSWPQPICSVGFLPDIPGRGGGRGPHQHDPVNLCGMLPSSLRAAVPLSPERAARGGTRRPRCVGVASVLSNPIGEDTGWRRTAKAAASPEREGGVTKKTLKAQPAE